MAKKNQLPASPLADAPLDERPPAPQPAVGGPGNVMTWTIPLRVTISLGSPVIQVAAAPPTPGAGPDDPELAEALAELEAGASRPYYDAAADARARSAYYQGVAANLPPAPMFEAVGKLTRNTHANKPAYKPSKHLYPWVDLRPDRKLRSIYSGARFEPLELIRQDLAVERARAERLAEFAATEAASPDALEAMAARLEAAMPLNCEHVVPQSWFTHKEPMRGDLHHLFACEPNCNSFRGNTPYFDFTDFGEAVMTDCGKKVGDRFEPGGGKAAVARATLYFLLRYPGRVRGTAAGYTPDRLAALLAWHAADPPGEYERHRNQAIFEKQGNRNPLIDHPEWASRIDFRLGLG